MAGMFEMDDHDGLDDEAFKGPTSEELLREIDISQLEPVELYTLRAQIDTLLPAPDMKTLDLSTEMVRQYQFVQQLQVRVIMSNDEPAKKATVLNAVNATLQHLVKMQSEFYTAERLKTIESLLITCLEELPKETLEPFFKKYREMGIERGF
jgi:hypothetical protein